MDCGEAAKKLMHFLDFVKTIPDEDAARGFVREARWRDGVVCPTCGGMDVLWLESRGRWQCRTSWCCRQFSVRTGTLFEKSRIPLRKWLIGMFKFMADHRGISSLRLARLVDVTQKSTFSQLLRLRRACQIDRDALTDVVEIDVMTFDGKENNQHLVKWRRYSDVRLKKQAVLGVFDDAGQMVQLGVMSEESAMDVLVSTLAPGIVSNDRRAYVLGEIHSNNIENALALWKRILGSTHLSWDKKHAQHYMNEVAFRMNEYLMGKSTVESMQTMIRNSVRLNNTVGVQHPQLPNVRRAQALLHKLKSMRNQVEKQQSQLSEFNQRLYG